MENQGSKVAIVGAGISGLTVARVFEDLGFDVSVFEASKTIRGIGAEIGLASNAMCAFENLGVADQIRKLGNPVEGFRICDPTGRSLFAIDTHRIQETYNEESYAIHRSELHALLANRLKTGSIFLSKPLERLEQQQDKVRLFFADASQADFDFVIGADGIHSATRQILVPGSHERYAGYWCWRCVARVPENFQLQGKALWGKKGRFGMKLMTRNRVYWFACINTPLTGEVRNYTLRDLKNHFKDYIDVPELLDFSREEDVIGDAVCDIAPLQQYFYRRILLIGDAAHATTPNMGQGAGMAAEDVAILKEELENNKVKTAFHNFEQRRLERTAYIIKNSRHAGRIAQLDRRIPIWIRNWAFRNLPAALMQAPIRRLYDEDFRAIKA